LLVVDERKTRSSQRVKVCRTGPIRGAASRVIESRDQGRDDRVWLIPGLWARDPGQKVDPQLQKLEAPQPSAKIRSKNKGDQ